DVGEIGGGAVGAGGSGGGAGGGPSRRRQRAPDLPLGHRAGPEADRGDLGAVHVAGHVERLHVAAHRLERQRALHATGRAREPVTRARARQRADDGGSRPHDAPGAPRVPGPPALLRSGHHDGQREGVTAGRRVMHGALATLRLALAAWGTSRSAHAIESPSGRVLDTFGDIAPWTAVASDGVRASVSPTAGEGGPGLRLDFDLAGTAGYALARRALSIDLPPRYEITFYLRADAPANQLQVKLLDASGENVWWFHRPDFAFPREWQLVRIKQRDIQFPWGATTDRRLH